MTQWGINNSMDNSMDNKNKLAKFAINANLDELQDIFDIEGALDCVIGELVCMDDDDIPRGIWSGLDMMRDRLDRMRNRSMIAPLVIRGEAPDSHSLVDGP